MEPRLKNAHPKKLHFSQKTREMGHPPGALERGAVLGEFLFPITRVTKLRPLLQNYYTCHLKSAANLKIVPSEQKSGDSREDPAGEN
jgi:hypothetical protein